VEITTKFMVQSDGDDKPRPMTCEDVRRLLHALPRNEREAILNDFPWPQRLDMYDQLAGVVTDDGFSSHEARLALAKLQRQALDLLRTWDSKQNKKCYTDERLLSSFAETLRK
jgi:hypothetical protein